MRVFRSNSTAHRFNPSTGTVCREFHEYPSRGLQPVRTLDSLQRNGIGGTTIVAPLLLKCGANTVFHKSRNSQSRAIDKRGAVMFNTPRRSMPAPRAWAWHPAFGYHRIMSGSSACVLHTVRSIARILKQRTKPPCANPRETRAEGSSLRESSKTRVPQNCARPPGSTTVAAVWLPLAILSLLAAFAVGSAAASGDPVPVQEQPASQEKADSGPEGKPATNTGVVIVEGQVTNAMGAGEPDVTITVHLKSKDGKTGKLVASARTDQMGDFKLRSPVIINADVVVTLSKPDYVALVRNLTLGDGEFPPFLAEQLEGKLVVEGRVTDALTGMSVAGAVTLRSSYRDWNTKSDRDGSFTIGHVSPGSADLIVEAKGYGREEVRIDEIGTGEGIAVRLKPERIVRLKLVDELGEPVPRVTVEAFDGPRDDFRSYVTGEDGVITMRGIHYDADTISLRLKEKDHVSPGNFDREIELPADKIESSHTLVMTRAGRIAGTVRDADSGTPLNGARIMTGEGKSDLSPRDWSNYRGEYQIDGVEPGATTVTVHLSGFSPDLRTVDVEAERTTQLDFKLSTGAVLSGRVVDDTGEPVPGAWVDATQWRDHTTLGLRAVTGDNGLFLMDSAPRDEFQIAVYARGTERVTVTVSADQNDDLKIVLPKAAARPAALKAGDSAPDAIMTTLAGQRLRLAELKGKTVLLDFWATWCGPCVAEVPHLRSIQEKYSSRKDFELISISLDGDERALRRFVKKNKMSWHQVFGEAGGAQAIADGFGVSGLPSVFLIGPDGTILATEMRGDETMKAVEVALRKEAP